MTALILLLSACSLFEKENPDENFEDFYQGSTDNNISVNNANGNSADNITITGENNGYQCTMVCEKKD
ncbi:MAG: hypothetical protein ACOC1P_04055 [Minisyncoccales bacterium]